LSSWLVCGESVILRLEGCLFCAGSDSWQHQSYWCNSQYCSRRDWQNFAERKVRQQERQRGREREEQRALKRPPSLEESIWASLDKIGREQSSSTDRDGASDAMDRIQQRPTEQQQEREREAAKVERERLELEKLEQERDYGIGLGRGI